MADKSKFWDNLDRAVNVLAKIWRLIKGSGPLRFFSLTFIAGVGLVGGPEASLGLFSWGTKLANFFFSTPIYEPDTTDSWFPRIVGVAILLLSMLFFYLLSKSEAANAQSEGAISFSLDEQTALRVVLPILKSAARKPIVWDALSEQQLDLLVEAGSYEAPSVVEALKALQNSVVKPTELAFDVIEEDGSLILRTKGIEDAKV